jgi:propanol-preferring alcohol dehydrogenase
MDALPLHDEAMALTSAGDPTLRRVERDVPRPGPGQLLLRVSVCGVCRTDLHLVDGELGSPRLPRVPGHEVVGKVVALGDGCQRFALGTRLGVPWLHDSCGVCRECEQQRENLCPHAHFTGMDVDGGYATYMLANEDFCYVLPQRYSDEQAAPLLCAGLIGWRALRLVGASATLGLYGFGAAGHLIAQVALQQGRRVYAFTRPGDEAAQSLARSLGVQWAGGSDQEPPSATDGAILFAPVGDLVPLALRHSAPGSTVVCAGIHMSDIPRFPYRLLWGERCVRSVANLTRQDGEEFFAWAEDHALTSTVEVFPLWQANEALSRLRDGRITGVAVLRCD